jgi:hypothetical protein
MVGLRCGRLSGLVRELHEELEGLSTDLLLGAIACRNLPLVSLAADVGIQALATSAEIAALMTKLAEYIEHRCQAEWGDRGPGRPA